MSTSEKRRMMNWDSDARKPKQKRPKSHRRHSWVYEENDIGKKALYDEAPLQIAPRRVGSRVGIQAVDKHNSSGSSNSSSRSSRVCVDGTSSQNSTENYDGDGDVNDADDDDSEMVSLSECTSDEDEMT